ncbi:hypothetical protein BJY04DRAFT_197027 [Aspergillus karnatakaensis]|uniref:uncharacterized protein n=1 Tax=Aspergillus karnatakaensis TaxID=1810916 RepID=UPI003CCD9181
MHCWLPSASREHAIDFEDLCDLCHLGAAASDSAIDLDLDFTFSFQVDSVLLSPTKSISSFCITRQPQLSLHYRRCDSFSPIYTYADTHGLAVALSVLVGGLLTSRWKRN